MSDDGTRMPRDPSQLRVMWLLNHGTARAFELHQMKQLGFREFFLPKSFPNEPSFRSATVDWSEDERLSIPSQDLAVLNAANWYRNPGKQVWDVANRHFHVVFFIAHDAEMLRSVRSFNGAKIWRAYGQQRPVLYSSMVSVSTWGAESIRRMGRRFFLGTAYAHLAEAEPAYLASRNVYLPIGLADVSCAGDWTGNDARILFVCPDIETNHYYAGVYRDFVNGLGTLPHAIAGMQAVHKSDPTVLGFVSREVHDQNMRSFRAMFYHSDEPNHVHYHPFEAVRAGMPLVFMAGGLLDQMGGRSLPGRCTSIAEARAKLARLLAGDQTLIDLVRSTQPVLLDAMKPQACLPAWRKGFAHILAETSAESAAAAARPKAAPRIAVILPISYRGGSLKSAKLVCEALRIGSAQCGNPAQIVLGHPDDASVYQDSDFADLHRDIKRRPFRWLTLDAMTAQRAMTFIEPLRPSLAGQYLVADDGMRQFMDCDLWLLVSDRLSLPLLPARPYAMLVFDYIQRYFDFLPPQSNLAFLAAANRADLVLVTTAFTRRDAIDYAGIAERKLRLVPMIGPFVDPTRQRQGGQTPSRPPYFLWPTNLGPHKNHSNAWRALQRYYALNADALDCRITGVDTGQMTPPGARVPPDGSSRGDQELPLAQRVIVHGDLDEDVYLDLMAGAQFVWHPTSIDNGALSVIEAAQLGVRSLASDYPAMREIQQRFNLDIMWFDARDPMDMARKLASMQAATSGAMCKSAGRETLDQIGPEVCARAYWRALAEML